MKHTGLIVNGYNWIGHYRGIHTFQKQEGKQLWSIIDCAEDQLTNGDIKFMTEHSLTLSKERINKEHKNYEIRRNKNRSG